MLGRPSSVVFLLVCQFIGFLAETWTGYRSQSSGTLQIVPSTATSVGIDLTVTTNSASDKVFLFVNINMASNAASAQLYFIIWRDSTDLATTGRVLAEAGPASSILPESQSATFAFMETPGGTAGSKAYVVYAQYSGTISSYGIVRQVGALVVPSSMATGGNTGYTSNSVSGAYSENLIPGLSATITPSTGTDMVLVSASFSVNANSNGMLMKVSLFRNNGRVDFNAMQYVSIATAWSNRQVTIFFLDSPGSNGVVTYSIQGTLLQGAGYTTCEGQDTVHINMLSVPKANTARAKSETGITVSSAAWITLGLLVTVRPVATTDKVLVTVNLNFQPSTAACVGAFTIFRNGINLGNAQYGLQIMNNPVVGSYAPVSMSFLDEPNAAGNDVTYEAQAIMYGPDSFVVGVNSQTSQLAAIVSNAVTVAPTLAPISTPTAVPTVPPAVIVQNSVVATLSVPPLFAMTMAITLPWSLTGVEPNIWDLQDAGSGTSLLALYRTGQTDTRLYYNGAPLSTANTIKIESTVSSGTVPSVHTITMGDTEIKLQSSSGYSGTFPIPVKVNTAGVTYKLYASAPSVVSSGGTFASFVLTELTGAPSTPPTSRPSGQPSRQPSSRPTSQPTRQPSGQPTGQPASRPTGQPTSQPSTRPTRQPSAQPSRQPSGQPSSGPTGQPNSRPTSQPTRQPSSQPSRQPSGQPSAQPTRQPFAPPTGQPSAEPTGRPSGQPSRQPTKQPSGQPSRQPTSQPTRQPSSQPSGQPIGAPTGQPSGGPSSQPTRQPSSQPSAQPSSQPVARPTGQPSGQPSSQPSAQPQGVPTSQPSGQPSTQPSRQPSGQPSRQPSSQPSGKPGVCPSGQPSSRPTQQPSGQPSRQPSSHPTSRPTGQPTTVPSAQPSDQPTTHPSSQPSMQPSARPTEQPSAQPSSRPTRQPSSRPSSQPVARPSGQPSSQPSGQPSNQPFGVPTSQPSMQPSTRPSCQPSSQPSGQPSAQPMAQPSSQPSSQPTSFPTSAPTTQPTGNPTGQPSHQPSSQPSGQPTSSPSCQPSGRPSGQPSSRPSVQPSSQPTVVPSQQPSSQPSTQPSGRPSTQPSVQPSTQPSETPSSQPTALPSSQPTSCPSSQPTVQPSAQPSGEPTGQPTSLPSTQPSEQPSSVPTTQPSGQPSCVPTVQPSSRPSAQPTAQPSSEPSAQPSSQPSSVPSTQPSGSPSAQPSACPSCQPSSQPTSLPTSQPSEQPTAEPSGQPTGSPSSQPSNQPSAVPSVQPSAVPSGQPSSQPTAQPSCQPVSRPTAQPSTQPSSQPSTRPSLAPTGEWATVVSQTSLLTKVSYPDDHVWACGKEVSKHAASCSLATLLSGELIAQYQFAWDSVLSVLSTNAADSVILNGGRIIGTSVTSETAICNTGQVHIQCQVRSFRDAHFLAASFVALPNTVVYVGWYNKYTSATLVDLTANSVRSYIYSAFNVKALTLSQVQSPPYFVGSFVAGTTVRATATPVNYIVAGMIRTDDGSLSAMALMPVSGDIANNVDLVTAKALENLGPDSFIAGGLQMDDGVGKHAYLLRANALFMSIQYCVRYRRSVTSGNRRSLSSAGATGSVARGVVLVEGALFMLVEHIMYNATALTVLKTSATDGAMLQQVHISARNGTSMNCTDLAAAAAFLSIICYTSNVTHPTSVLLLVDRDLSFAVIPAGFVRSEESLFQAESVPFKRTILAVTKSSTVVATTEYEFHSEDTKPTQRPTAAPSLAPSVQPSEVPSSQPTSSPTAAPSVSEHPTSVPSTSGPTNTYRPTVAPTIAPTKKPSAAPTPRPSPQATPNPSARPTVSQTSSPTVKPTAGPNASPTITPKASPSTRPTAAPSARPATFETAAPTVPTTTAHSDADSDRSSMQPYVLVASVGGGLGLLLVGFLLYQYNEDVEKIKERDERKAEYFRQQALLAEQTRIEKEKKKEEKEKKRKAQKAQKAHMAFKKHINRSKRGRTISGVSSSRCSVISESERSPSPVQSSARSSSYNVSSLHSSEDDFEQYKVRRYRRSKDITGPLLGNRMRHRSRSDASGKPSIASLFSSSASDSSDFDISSAREAERDQATGSDASRDSGNSDVWYSDSGASSSGVESSDTSVDDSSVSASSHSTTSSITYD